jgi:hypothetical protein
VAAASGAQLSIIINAKNGAGSSTTKTKTHKKKCEQSKVEGARKNENSSPSSADEEKPTSYFNKKTPRTKIEMPAVGGKRGIDDIEGSARLQDSKGTGRQQNKSKAPNSIPQQTTRQTRREGEETVSSKKPDAPPVRGAYVFPH